MARDHFQWHAIRLAVYHSVSRRETTGIVAAEGIEVVRRGHSDGINRQHVLDTRRQGRRRTRLVLISVAGSVVVLVVLEIAAVVVIRNAATASSLDEAARLGSESVQVALTPFLTDELVALDPAARAAIEAPGTALIERDNISHIKIWSESGVVLWSDQKEIVGRSFELGADERELFTSPGLVAEVSNLDKIENENEVASGEDRLLEVYVGTTTTRGTPIVLEIYSPYSLVTDSAATLAAKFIPLMTATLVALAVAQISLVLLLARRLRRFEGRHRELLERVIESSDIERRRIAAEVHDGVVQDLIGITFSLSALAETMPAQSDALGELAGSTRAAVASLRSLLDSIYPIEVPAGGWRAGLEDLIDGLGQFGVNVRIDGDDTPLTAMEELLVLRVTREALRNVASHAGASEVTIRLVEQRGRLVLTIRDDGCGFEPTERKEGHVGLRLLSDAVHDADGALSIESSPGAGTLLRVELETTP